MIKDRFYLSISHILSFAFVAAPASKRSCIISVLEERMEFMSAVLPCYSNIKVQYRYTHVSYERKR